ncbi:hypothetical protein LSUB1_G000720 [Lachnellula subtilissima]|uniref:BTB domain-containing protein n=1 Tax=Lachnellula subtilissima TaxID=602034 RepID=A0A8H8S1Y4_9HELO|nr:hypothetical protein LSUB1_G000720 [Lachnellula subtilissima]
MDTAWPQTWPTQAEELHTFDPKGDILLLLGRRLPEDITDDMNCLLSLLSSLNGAEEIESSSEDTEVASAEEAALPIEPFEPEAPELGFRLHQTRPYSPPMPSYSSSSSASSDKELESRIQQVQMRVSSKHLILASRTFSTMLNAFSEGRVLRTEGKLTLPLPEEEPDVMIIILHIIHGQNRKVPRQVSLDLFSKLAAAVNYYHIQEVVELFSDIWIEGLKKNPLPTSYTPEVLRWLFIFWVFRKEDGFRNMTRILQRESDENLWDEANAVPTIPASIISTLQKNRIEGIKALIQVIYDIINKYAAADTLCDNDQSACDASVLGTIMKSSAAMGIWPQPERPYPNLTYKAIVERIEEIQFPETCVLDERRYISYGSIHPNLHGIKEVIGTLIESLENNMYGLELESFLPTQDKERL